MTDFKHTLHVEGDKDMRTREGDLPARSVGCALGIYQYISQTAGDALVSLECCLKGLLILYDCNII